MQWKIVALAAAAVLGTTACASTGQTPMHNAVASANAPVQVTVRNDNNDNVDVYAMVSGKYQRLATVPALETRTLPLPMQANTPKGVELQVKAVGSGMTYVTHDILVQPGQDIDLRVSNKLQQSSWAVD